MKLATRTALAAVGAATLTLIVTVVVATVSFNSAFVARTDAQLSERAETAPILAAVGPRLGRSELNGALPGARIIASDGTETTLGAVPTPVGLAAFEPGFRTVEVAGERWRVLGVTVQDVPQRGDVTRVELVEPLGPVEATARDLRRRAWRRNAWILAGAAAVGAGFGAVATRPLTALRRDASAVDDAEPRTWQVAESYGSPEVDEIAETLNATFTRLAAETDRRGAALEAARGFASAATHEMRVPLQGALTSLNLAASSQLDQRERDEMVDRAMTEVRRTAAALAAVRALAEAEFADPAWFVPTPLDDLVESAVASEVRDTVAVEFETQDEPERPPLLIWPDGVTVAVANVARNAVHHGLPAGPDAPAPRISVIVHGATVIIDDNGPGIDPADRDRLLGRFERGHPDEAAGTGLGLAIAREVAAAHGGSVHLVASPLGGTRVILHFAPPPATNRSTS